MRKGEKNYFGTCKCPCGEEYKSATLDGNVECPECGAPGVEQD